jgi:hypothetical protein
VGNLPPEPAQSIKLPLDSSQALNLVRCYAFTARPIQRAGLVYVHGSHVAWREERFYRGVGYAAGTVQNQNGRMALQSMFS